MRPFSYFIRARSYRTNRFMRRRRTSREDAPYQNHQQTILQTRHPRVLAIRRKFVKQKTGQNGINAKFSGNGPSMVLTTIEFGLNSTPPGLVK